MNKKEADQASRELLARLRQRAIDKLSCPVCQLPMWTHNDRDRDLCLGLAQLRAYDGVPD